MYRFFYYIYNMKTLAYLIHTSDRYIIVDKYNNEIASTEYKYNSLLKTKKPLISDGIVISLKECELLFKFDELIESTPLGVDGIHVDAEALYQNATSKIQLYSSENRILLKNKTVDNLYVVYKPLPIYSCQFCHWRAENVYIIENQIILRCKLHALEETKIKSIKNIFAH